MLLDTCHAANAFNPRLEKDAADARIVVFSATAANSTAAELPELGHGVFTYSVLEGLRGAAKTSGDGVRLLRACRLYLPRGDETHQCAAEAVLLCQRHGEHFACAAVSRTTSTPGLAGHFAGFLPLLSWPGRWRRLRTLSLPACPPGDANYPRFYDSSDLFDRAIAKVADYPPSNVRLTGITVPHHLLADHLVALGFRAASGSILQAHRHPVAGPFPQDGQAVRDDEARLRHRLGPVATDAASRSRLLAGRRLDRGTPACSTRSMASGRCCPSCITIFPKR